MSLPVVDGFSLQFAPSFVEKLLSLGVSRAMMPRWLEGDNNLRQPLIATREALLSEDASALAARLFFAGEAVATSRTNDLLGPSFVEQALADGLLVRTEDEIRFPFHLRIVRDIFLLSDYLNDAPDEVMGAGETTAVLFKAGRPVSSIGTLLDLGCGAGTVALLMAQSADRVIGTDINPRAIQIAGWNAAANSIANAEFRCGSLYDPVQHQRFDLILSQPPYYPTPDDRPELTFLHGGVRGDELAQAVVRNAAAHLTVGGRALVFASWRDDSWWDLQEITNSGQQILQFGTSRRELHGSRQGLTVIEQSQRGYGWLTNIAVSADRWGNIRQAHIDRFFANEQLLNANPSAARLEWTDDLQMMEEDGNYLVIGNQRSLINCVALSEHEYRLLSGFVDGVQADTTSPIVRKALRLGITQLTKI